MTQAKAKTVTTTTEAQKRWYVILVSNLYTSAGQFRQKDRVELPIDEGDEYVKAEKAAPTDAPKEDAS